VPPSGGREGDDTSSPASFCQLDGKPAAKRVADEMRSLEASGIHVGLELIGQVTDRVGLLRARQPCVAGQVRREDIKGVGNQWDHTPPTFPRTRGSMDQEKGLARTSTECRTI
jgi:hypothetical protein